MSIKLVSLGTACRPGYHAHRLASLQEGFEKPSLPFDWTITPFDSLRRCMARGFDPQDALPPDNLIINKWGSVTCGATGLLFHHDLLRDRIPALGGFDIGDRLPDTAAVREVVEQARGRFLHTFAKLEGLRNHSDGIVFVRWVRLHQGARPMVTRLYDGETDESLKALLSDFLGHRDYHVLIVESDIVPDRTDPFETPIVDFRADGRLVTIRLQERQGWNGDQSDNYKGDEPSWDAALDRAMAYWGLPG